MGRKKIQDAAMALNRRLILRVNDSTFQKLDALMKDSDCQSVSDVARRILCKKKITVFYKDISLEASVTELIRIRKELNAIGVNINQITHFFHAANNTNNKMFQALKVAEEYSKVGDKVDELLRMVAQLGRKWLQG
jgi:hypothetical protein